MKATHLLATLFGCFMLLGQVSAGEPVNISLTSSQATLESGQGHTLYLRIGIEGLRLAPKKDRAPINVALVLDRSGSMRGEKLDNAKEAVTMALDYLDKRDTVALITYSHDAEVVRPAALLTDKSKLMRAIRRIKSGGNTALYAGVEAGAEEIRRFQESGLINRIILLSDGLANNGPSTPEALGKLGQQLGGERMSVTTIGLGLGYNEDLMVRLANASDGNHLFAEEPAELASVFRNEFGELGSAVAQDVTITIECGEGVKPLRMLGRSAKIEGRRVTARLNQIYGNQEKFLLLEVEASAESQQKQRKLASLKVNYENLSTRQQVQQEDNVEISYTASKEKAKASINSDVMVYATEQIATELDDEALKLKDSGDTDGARSVLRQKADYLKKGADLYGSSRLEAQAEKTQEMEKSVAAPASEWNRARKQIREEQSILRNQQSYR